MHASPVFQRKPRIAVLATGAPAGEVGGAERFYIGLRDALVRAGADAEIVYEVSHEANFAAILESYLRFYDLDLSAYDGVISTKAPGYMIRHRNHVCYLQHTMRVFYDMFQVEFPQVTDELLAQRRIVHLLDTEALRAPRTRKIFVVGEEVQQRLEYFNGTSSEVLHQASTLEGFHTGGQRYFFLPGRLHRWKRVDLAIEAMRLTKAPVDLLISGTGEDEAKFRTLTETDPRIRFLGRVSDEKLLNYYADALAVLFVPLREDFGLITQEAFLSAKPVITCLDSGEPTRLVRDGVTGFVVEPTAAALSEAMMALAGDPDRARVMGAQGRQDIRALSWEKVADRLLAALGFATKVQA
ncbi:MAG: glycosyltransferase family 4 protein [Alphaproteobacteria bacterium]|nr:glycosyltransferase family 4 protein [Alphaproteobacteria bacterium]